MNKQMIVNFWSAVVNQEKEELQKYFHSEGYVEWVNTNEHFSVDEYIIANCEYPGSWYCNIERMEEVGDLIITVTHVYTKNSNTSDIDLSNSTKDKVISGILSFHVTSFFEVIEDKIVVLKEYWGDDQEPPQWRKDKKIGRKIVE